MANQVTDYVPTFYIGHHELSRAHPVTDVLLQQVHTVGYDMITVPITTQLFQSRVLALVKTYLSELSPETYKDRPTELPSLPIIPPLQPADTFLSPLESISQVIACTSSWIDLGSTDPLISSISKQVLNIEISYASFCGIGHILIPGPKSITLGSNANDLLIQYARAIQEALAIGNFIQISICLPMYISENLQDKNRDLSSYARFQFTAEKSYDRSENNLYESWDTWNLIRSVCQYNSRLLVALEIPRILPIGSLQSRWYAEPLRMLCFPASTFLINKGGNPVLSKAHQNLITRYMRLKLFPWILLCDVGPLAKFEDTSSTPELITKPSLLSDSVGEESHSELCFETEIEKPSIIASSNHNVSSRNASVYLLYMRYLQKNQPARTVIESFGSGYQDFLQAPLQPLADNLESITYEVFEKDPVKYDWYEKAIFCALTDWSRESKPTSSTDGSVVIAVVGSGRGPLVSRALKASETSGVPVQLWAVEKNPNAYVLLQRINKEKWGGVVNIVKSDMRAWKGPICKDMNDVARDTPSNTSKKNYGHVDILVSELLGSFADNELSPECLDGVQHVLAPEYGISIPSSYTAHLTPILAPRLHAEISQRSLVEETATEVPYVVMLNAIDFLASHVPGHPRIQKAWEFTHPIPTSTLFVSSARRNGGVSGGGGGSMCGGDGANEHNVRAAHLKFICKDRGVMHGIAGYFEAVLYDGGANGKIELSTRPDTIEAKSKDMISWFPIYFPLKNPLYFPDDSELEVSMWRQTDDRKVWYEWLVEAFIMVGPECRLRLGMSDLNSSRKSGCLM
ncbi:Protein arginine N-methyltransferase skb1 [Erysiphe neolycopersici]|uniref:Protein arginine N-methyltransferase n=1 Tax=Erysiphe neolycopersici TaxID=212602 RepID=A0A420HY47_9PEZI|nr:Protein arginine N-methyltransferase skb1 [Erysiphe neolycopersici]